MLYKVVVFSRGKRTTEKKKRRRKKDEAGDDTAMDEDEDSGEEEEDNEANDMEVSEEDIQKLSLKNEADASEMSQTTNSNSNGDMTCDDSREVTQTEAMEAEEESVFKLTIGPQSSASNDGGATGGVVSERTNVFMPSPRMNTVTAVKNGQLFVYGGMYEAGDRQFTFADFYSLDVHKLDEWNIIIENNIKDQVR